MEITKSMKTKLWDLSILAAPFGALLLYISSYIRIPCYPVAFTGHTLVLFLIGLAQPPKTAFFSAFIYLCVGTPFVLGPTTGYLFAMPLAAYLVSCMKDSPLKGLLLGQSLIYVLGIMNLTCYVGFSKAFIHGFLVFVPSAFIKISLAYRFAKAWRHI